MLIQSLKIAHHLLCGSSLHFSLFSPPLPHIFLLPAPPRQFIYRRVANLPARGIARAIWENTSFAPLLSDGEPETNVLISALILIAEAETTRSNCDPEASLDITHVARLGYHTACKLMLLEEN